MPKEEFVLRILILAGGSSPERDVSLLSGAMIANALSQRGHEILLLDPFVGLSKLPLEDPATWGELLFRKGRHYPVPSLGASPPPRSGAGDVPGENLIKLCSLADRVFLALHGSTGENGTLQATLSLHGISYTGSDAVGSMLAMDKDLTKRLLLHAGIPTPEWILLDKDRPSSEGIVARVGLPCVIKPVSCGSSVGISMVERDTELPTAIAEASKWGCDVMAERRIVGRELTVGILDGTPLPAVEIRPREGFYDYRNKYNGKTEELCPAPLPPHIASRAAAFSLRAFRALRLKGYARFDYILDGVGKLWCLEANTLPGMTPTSLFPLAAAAAGIEYGELCERILMAK